MTYRRRLGCGGRRHTANGSAEVVLSLGQGGTQLCNLGLITHILDVTIVQHPSYHVLCIVVYSIIEEEREVG